MTLDAVLGEVPTAAAVLAVLGGCLGISAWARRRGLIGAEGARKLVHVVMGTVAAGFPWLFAGSWPVIALCTAAAAALAVMRCSARLRGRFGAGLHDVARSSWGELVYPVAILGTWMLADGGRDRMLYLAAMLVLAFADAVAALVGGRYGRSPFQAVGGRKSWEGSLAFFTVAFLAVHVPLLLGTGIGRTESLLIAGAIAFVVMMVEAIAWRGFDNLMIPCLVAVLILRYRELDQPQLAARFAVAVGLFLVAWWSRRHTRLSDAAAFGGAILAYAAYGLHHVGWLVPALAVLILHPWLRPRSHRLEDNSLTTVVAVAGPPLAIAVMGFARDDPLSVWNQHAAWAMALSAIALVRFASARPRVPLALLVPICAGGGAAVLLPSAAAVHVVADLPGPWWSHLALAAATVLVATAIFAAAEPRLRDAPMDRLRWYTQFLVVVACASIGLWP